jgi:hypothetical protein
MILLGWKFTLTYLISQLKIFNNLCLLSVVRLPSSPASEKKQKQQLSMTAEKKKAQQDKNRLS